MRGGSKGTEEGEWRMRSEGRKGGGKRKEGGGGGEEVGSAC